MLKYFRCNKCGWQSYGPSDGPKLEMKCGAVVQYLVAEDFEVSLGEDPVRSLGLKPIGCGGKIKEISLEEAMSHVRRE